MALRIHSQMAADPAATEILFYVCDFEEFVSSKLFVCNTAGAATFGLAVLSASSDALTVTTVNRLYGPTEAIAANTTIVLPAGITLARGDAMFIRASAATVVFTLFGEGVGEEG